jgi:tryptophan halogenase
LYDDETFQEHDWESLFIGHELIPQSYDPRVDGVPEQDLIGQVQKRLHEVLALAESMPTTEHFIAAPVDPPAAAPETTSSAHI